MNGDDDKNLSSKEDDEEENGENGDNQADDSKDSKDDTNGNGDADDHEDTAEEADDQSVVPAEKLLDNSNVDNEDSLNLTIGEDEAKIFQDEVCDMVVERSIYRNFYNFLA